MINEEIAQLLKAEGSGFPLSQEPDEVADAQEPRQRRTKLLGIVLSTCQEAWESGSEELDAFSQTIGDGSRDVVWRLPYGDSGILDFFLKLLKEDNLRPKVKSNSLRIVGNSCADTDENRARIVDGRHLDSITRLLQDESVVTLIIPVLYNILVDYEPAQRFASESHLNKQLTALLKARILPGPLINYVCKVLALLITQDGEPLVANPETVNILLDLATNSEAKDDVEDFITLVSVAAAYLANETFQSNLVAGSDLNCFMDAFYHAHTHFKLEELDDEDIVTSLKQLRASLLALLADLSGNDVFASSHPLDSQVPQSLLVWLKGSNPLLQSAACLALGNFSRSDEISQALVQEQKAHQPLVNLLSNTAVTDPQLLHGTLSFLKNLAIPSANKPLLGDLLDDARVPRIYTLDTLPQVQFAAVSLTRLLLIKCPTNVRRICAPRGLSDSGLASTSFQDLLSLFQRSDAEPTKLEAARCITNLCRVAFSEQVASVIPAWDATAEQWQYDAQEQPEGTESGRRKELFDNHDISKPLLFLLTQQKWPTLRSEAWFIYAHMSRFSDGASIVANVLKTEEATKALTEAITGETGSQTKQIESSAAVSEELLHSTSEGLSMEPKQVDPRHKANMARVDRENCLIMCKEIVKSQASSGPTPPLAYLQDLISRGISIIAAEKKD